ncbi:trehalose synthase-fused probable maltokinase [Neolewinella xylanilytica]|uniref:Maltokinase n=1 Tax=Neolewinella xylanilytica TaxID=1514080 RepID=A0A2S6I0J5_9BACT|nr:putative maltokinase [Neolewinella xylanilytica]PPK84393.1 trehalose synthase-fused probable maltokinase [Neolewinella xylanilytica]
MPVTPFSRLFEDPDFTDALTNVLLPGYLPGQRWFTSKGKSITTCRVDAVYPVQEDAGIVTISVDFNDGSRERYQMPLALNFTKERRTMYQERFPKLILGEITGTGMLADAVPRDDFRARLYEMILNNAEGENGLNAEAGSALRAAGASTTSTVPAIDTSNTAIIYDDRFFFKLFRKLGVGLNPDLELVRFLSERTAFDNCPPYGGSLGVGSMENDEEYLNLGLMTGKVDNRGDAWELFQQLTEEYFADDDRTVGKHTIDRARQLGERTAEMHRALASAGPDRPDLAPEEMTPAYRAEITDAALRLLERQFAQLAEKMDGLPGPEQVLARRVLGAHGQLNDRLSSLRDRPLEAQLTRIHGDYHLGQVLYTDTDFYIIDFEGEPLLTIPERRRKRPPLKDVGGMVRSFHYAAQGQLLLNAERYRGRDLTERAEAWYREVSANYLDAYFAASGDAPYLPAREEDRRALLNLFILEKAVYEVAYELNSRPAWLAIPLNGVLSLV